MSTYQIELERLYQHHFGDRADLWVRLFGTLIGSGVLYAYAGWPEAWLWSLGVFVMHGIQYTHYRATRITGERGTFLFVVVLTQITLLSFMWMPVVMLVSEDEVLRICGAAILGSILIYLMHTADRSRILIVSQLAVMTLAVLSILWVVLPNHPEPMARVGLLYSVTTFLAYLAICLFAARRRRQNSEAMAERTAQAQKMEAVGQLAGGVAHDFNNMLTAVIGNLDLYDAIEDPRERKQFIKDARDAAMRGQKVVEQLLHFSRLSPNDPKQYSASALLSEIDKLHRHLVPASVILDFDTSDDTPKVWVDENLFITAMLNLISNAADAVQRKGTLKITADRQTLDTPLTTVSGTTLPQGSYAAFSVEDTGPGIPEQVLRRVAEPFYTSKPVGQGSGLGLATASSFAERSGGGLVIDTSPHGTTVTVMLPAVVDEKEPYRMRRAAAQAKRSVSFAP